MDLLLNIWIILIALQHFLFFIMESILWRSLGRKIFGKGRNIDFFKDTAPLAFNQGVYNLFLCAGLLLSLMLREDQCSGILRNFFLICIVTAGIAGGWSVSRRIFIVQGIPAMIALLLSIVA